MAIVESHTVQVDLPEGNALFGVRTWSKDVPDETGTPNAKFGVKKYKTKCPSVADVIDILNRQRHTKNSE